MYTRSEIAFIHGKSSDYTSIIGTELLILLVMAIMICNILTMILYILIRKFITYTVNNIVDYNKRSDEPPSLLYGTDGLIPANRQTNSLIVTKLNQEVKVPRLSHDMDVGYEIYSAENVILRSGERRLVSTAITVKPPEGYFCKLEPKSGIAAMGVDIGAGIIDPGYEGEVKVLVINNSRNDYRITFNQRIAQLVLYQFKTTHIGIVSNNEFAFIRKSNSSAKRNDNAFGSTGLN